MLVRLTESKSAFPWFETARESPGRRRGCEISLVLRRDFVSITVLSNEMSGFISALRLEMNDER